MKKTLLYFFILFSFFICASARAQQNATISGKVTASEKPVEAASIALLKIKDSSTVKVEVTDKQGNFQFENIKPGNYLVQADVLGYKKIFTPSFQVSNTNSTVHLDEIKLTEELKELMAVNVTANRPLIENKADKTVVNVDASPTNSGLTALEVLEKSPGVNVDNDGNIKMKGKQGVKILIDGKPSYLQGQDLVNYLRNLPANQLDQIELMTQPSAKYDASGNSGIINFKTKKNKNNGFNGSITTSAIIARYFKNTNSLNFNWRQGKINVFGNFGYSAWKGFNDIYIDRSFRDSASVPFNRYYQQHTYGRYSNYPFNFKSGVDFFANKTTTVTLTVDGLVDGSRFKSNSTSNIYDSLKNFVQYNDALSENHNPWTNVGFDLSLQKKLKKGGELDLDGDYIFYDTKGNTYSYNYLKNPDGSLVADTSAPNPYLLNGDLPAHIDIYSFKADYSQPLKNNLTFEAGVKLSYVKTDNDALYTLYDTVTDKWYLDQARTNHFIYKENINAGYVNFQKQFKKFSVQLGLRAEQTISDGNQVIKNETFHKNYTQLFPTSYFSYKLNDNNTFSLSYGRRIERPSYQDLNPFQFQLDRYTYMQGNPDLQPQFSHNIELSYNYKGDLNFTVNYTDVTDIINDVLETVKDGENYSTFQTKENIASNRNIGLSVNYNKQLKKWWSINVFGNVYNNKYKGVIGDEPIDINITAFNGNLNNQFTFKKGWRAELSGFYTSKDWVSSNILGDPIGMFSLGGSKTILKNKGTVKVNVRDPFYLMHFTGNTELDGFTAHIHSTWDNRRLIFTFVYRFGKTNGQQQRRRTTAAEEEQNRVNTGGGQQ
ncbi:MAG TPA: TonB-dependent receptor [Parafilimonas sp.]|nr:TonB-dependent receptor [Parafilimonas sp.]